MRGQSVWLHVPDSSRGEQCARDGMKLSWFKQSKVIVEVLDDEILVTMPGTSFSIVYERPSYNQPRLHLATPGGIRWDPFTPHML